TGSRVSEQRKITKRFMRNSEGLRIPRRVVKVRSDNVSSR
ncbi:uncharacterized, partial [Tachysurus ichikawai]